ncbi:RDD family protein [Corynebacterium ciconiae DSM 44920]|uniref:RDD family protein n=1 Tax=Corynebacterium ciconiae TaxID=227319 RepID=UPI000381E614|nr:RDD family protein [Corynebacterium ciconiae]WKD61994.1 RDD family protein [Corynebacterium ciconiae DSM 44920]
MEYEYSRSAQAGQRQRFFPSGVQDMMSPPVNYSDLERYQAFSPGRNRGRRDVHCAPVLRRLAAQALDAAVFSVALLAMFIAVIWGTGSEALTSAAALTMILGWPGGYYLYQTAGDVCGGSVGKRLMGLRVVAPAAMPVPISSAARRNLWILLNYIPVAGPVAALGVAGWLGADARTDAFGMGPHDRGAELRVVRPE